MLHYDFCTSHDSVRKYSNLGLFDSEPEDTNDSTILNWVCAPGSPCGGVVSVWARRVVVKTVFPWVASRANMMYLGAHTHNNRDAVCRLIILQLCGSSVPTGYYPLATHGNTVLTTNVELRSRCSHVRPSSSSS